MVPQHSYLLNDGQQQGIKVGFLQHRRLRKGLNRPLPYSRFRDLSQSNMDIQPTKHHKHQKKEQGFQPKTLLLPAIRQPKVKQKCWNKRQTPKQNRQIQLIFEDGRAINHQFSQLIQQSDFRRVEDPQNRLYSYQSCNKIRRSKRVRSRVSSQAYSLHFEGSGIDFQHKNDFNRLEQQLTNVQIKDPFDGSERKESPAFIRLINQCQKYNKMSQESMISLFNQHYSCRM